jgi:TctA family transporter
MDAISQFLTTESYVAVMAGKAFVIMMDPTRLGFLCLGALLGLTLGIIPGIGGLAGTAMLLPFTFDMDPYTAFAFLLGLGSTAATGDPIPAILFGVPGGAASAATVLDGYPMAKRGEAGRALSAAYMSSLLGGLFGAALMAITIPILRPVMLFIGSPELLGFAVFGMSMVAVLSGSAPLRGIAAGCFGIMCAMIGSDPQTGTLRWTFDSLYLWDGLPLTPLVLGIYALPELCDLLVLRTSVAAGGAEKVSVYKGQWQGVKDCFRHWWLIMRCSWIGGGIGSIPGISASVVDWLAYGHALRTEKGASKTFGLGDVRGVIASESSNNAKEGGALVPTVAFGVPGSATMAILLGAFLIHGLVPGPDMLTKNLDITFSMVWSIALANILGAGMCYAFSPQFAKLATLRYTLILPGVLGIVYIGSFEASRQWGDLYGLLFFGLLGWVMKQFKWPRPPLILGVVLGDIIERYLFISVERYGLDWMTRPVVAIMFVLAFVGLVRPFIQDVRIQGGFVRMFTQFGAPRFKYSQLFTVFYLVMMAYMVGVAFTWNFDARIVPVIVGSFGVFVVCVSLFNEVFRSERAVKVEGIGEAAEKEVEQKIHMDLDSGTDHLSHKEVISRAALFFGYLIGFMAVMYAIGLIPTAGLFVIFFMRYEGKERWRLTLTYAACTVGLIYVMFDQVMAVPWPQTLVGQWFPVLKSIIPSM